MTEKRSQYPTKEEYARKKEKLTKLYLYFIRNHKNMSVNEMSRESGISYATGRSIVVKMRKEGINIEPRKSSAAGPNWELIKAEAAKLKIK